MVNAWRHIELALLGSLCFIRWTIQSVRLHLNYTCI